jgi:hypothetical protein
MENQTSNHGWWSSSVEPFQTLSGLLEQLGFATLLRQPCKINRNNTFRAMKITQNCTQHANWRCHDVLRTVYSAHVSSFTPEA